MLSQSLQSLLRRFHCVVTCTSLAAILLAAFGSHSARGQAKGEIEIDLIDDKSSEKLLSRVQLRGPNGNLLKPRSLEVVQGWSLVDGQLAFRGRPADYRYEVYHGPEYAPARGQFILDKNSETIDTIELPRHANLADESWFGGDLLSYQPKQSADRWLPAEGLKFASSVSLLTFNRPALEQPDSSIDKTDPVFTAVADDRPGSGLTIHHWRPTEELNELAPSSRLIVLSKQAPRETGQTPAHVEIRKLWARDLPIWLASGRIDSVQLLSPHLTHDGSRAEEVHALVTPDGNFRGARAAGRIIEQIYWKILDAGLRIPPSAGSGFGKSPSPLGYNRVYAQVGSPTEDNWWKAIRQGNSFVSNGPLLRVAINGMPPGHVFQGNNSIELDVGIVLTTSDPVEYLEVLFNGSSIYKAALDEYAKQGGKIPTLEIKQSGWLIVRVVTARDFTYRLASTAPFYFELDNRQRIDPTAIEFFQRWLSLAREDILKLPLDVQALHEPYLKSAERFWDARANLVGP